MCDVAHPYLSIEPVDLNDDLHELLTAIGPGLKGRQVLLTPHAVRDDQTLYTTQDVYAERDARLLGLDAEFAVPAAERRWIGEYSAATVITTMGMTVGSGLTVATITGIVKYVKHRFQRAGSPDHPASQALPEHHVRVTLTRLHEQDELPGIDTVAIEGRPDDVGEAIRELLTPYAVDSPQGRHALPTKSPDGDDGD